MTKKWHTERPGAQRKRDREASKRSEQASLAAGRQRMDDAQLAYAKLCVRLDRSHAAGWRYLAKVYAVATTSEGVAALTAWAKANGIAVRKNADYFSWAAQAARPHGTPPNRRQVSLEARAMRYVANQAVEIDDAENFIRDHGGCSALAKLDTLSRNAEQRPKAADLSDLEVDEPADLIDENERKVPDRSARERMAKRLRKRRRVVAASMARVMLLKSETMTTVSFQGSKELPDGLVLLVAKNKAGKMDLKLAAPADEVPSALVKLRRWQRQKD